MGSTGWGTTADDVPRVHDEPPPPWVGVPVERDPVTGRPLRGRPGGRTDKARHRSSARLPWVVAASALLLVCATAGTVALVSGSDAAAPAAQGPGSADGNPGSADGDPAGTDGGPGGTGRDPADAADEPGSGAEGPAEAGRRAVPMEFTVTAIRTPPGQEGRYGTVGETSDAIWQLTGPCDGAGPCAVEHCVDEQVCTLEFDLDPTGSGYTGQFEFSWFGDPWPECGAVRVAVDVAVSQGGDVPAYSGTWTQSHGAPLGYDGGTSHCDIALTDVSFRSV